jgi:hypothetical protein
VNLALSTTGTPGVYETGAFTVLVNDLDLVTGRLGCPSSIELDAGFSLEPEQEMDFV